MSIMSSRARERERQRDTNEREVVRGVWTHIHMKTHVHMKTDFS